MRDGTSLSSIQISGLSYLTMYPLIPISLILLLSAYTDATRRVIPNWLTASATIGGIIFNTTKNGANGFLFSVVGLLGGLIIGLLFYNFLFLGAGDTKLIASLGSWIGALASAKILFWGIVIGGIFSVVVMAYRGELFERFSIIKKYILYYKYTKHLKPNHFNDKLKNIDLPMAIPIAIGFYIHYFGEILL